MADKIVSWGGYESKGTSGMSVTGSLGIINTSTSSSVLLDINGSTNNSFTFIANPVLNAGERGLKVNVSTAGYSNNGGSIPYDFKVGGTSYFTIANYGLATFAQSVQTPSLLIQGNPSNATSLRVYSQGASGNAIETPGSEGTVHLGSNTVNTKVNEILRITGKGTTSSTTSLLVQNANASSSFQIKDDRVATFYQTSNATAAEFNFGNNNSAVKVKSHSTSTDFTQIEIGNNFALSRNGGGNPSISTSNAGINFITAGDGASTSYTSWFMFSEGSNKSTTIALSAAGGKLATIGAANGNDNNPFRIANPYGFAQDVTITDVNSFNITHDNVNLIRVARGTALNTSGEENGLLLKGMPSVVTNSSTTAVATSGSNTLTYSGANYNGLVNNARLWIYTGSSSNLSTPDLYTISSVDTGTKTITLDRPYEGTSGTVYPYIEDNTVNIRNFSGDLVAELKADKQTKLYGNLTVTGSITSTGYIQPQYIASSASVVVMKNINGAEYVTDMSTGGTGDLRFYYGGGGGWSYNWYTDNTHRVRISDGGMGINIGNTNPSARLHVKGSGTTSSTTSLLVQNSSGNPIFQATDDRSFTTNGVNTYLSSQYVFCGTLGLNAGSTSATGTGIYSTGTDAKVVIATSRQGALIANFAGGLVALLSIDNPRNILQISSGFQDGNTPGLTGNTLNITPTYNFLGTHTSATVRGIYYNPTLTSLTNTSHYGIQTTSGGAYINTATPDASAALQADSTTQGFLPPRMTTAEKTAIASPAAGLMVYDTSLNQMSYYNGSTWVNF